MKLTDTDLRAWDLAHDNACRCRYIFGLDAQFWQMVAEPIARVTDVPYNAGIRLEFGKDIATLVLKWRSGNGSLVNSILCGERNDPSAAVADAVLGPIEKPATPILDAVRRNIL